MRVLIYKLKEWYAKAFTDYQESKVVQNLPYPNFVSKRIGELPEVPKSKAKVKTGKTKRKKAGKKTIETKY